MSDVKHAKKKSVQERLGITTQEEIDAQIKRLAKQKQREEEFKAKYEAKRQKRVGEDIEAYLDSKLGKRPTASASTRRWQMLRDLAKHIAYRGETDFDELRRWTAPNLQCMKDRTLRDDYLTYLADLEVISYSSNSQIVAWKGM